MRAVVQRVSSASVTVDETIVGQIQQGMLVLLGVSEDDTEKEAEYLSEKIGHLRIFDDEAGKMNLSLHDIQGQMLVVSQFTLYGDCRKGRRPSFVKAAVPELGNRLYEYFVGLISEQGILTQTGQFQADMQVAANNDGPVTLLLDSSKEF